MTFLVLLIYIYVTKGDIRMVMLKYEARQQLNPKDKKKFERILAKDGLRVLNGTDDHGRGNFFYTSYYILTNQKGRMLGYLEY